MSDTAILEAINGLKDEFRQQREESRALREDVGTLTVYVKGRKMGPNIKTSEAAEILGMLDRKFREQFVPGLIQPLKGRTSIFLRRDVLKLKELKDRGIL